MKEQKRRMFCAAVWLLAIGFSAAQPNKPRVLTKGGELTFIAAPGQDIGFQTAAGGKLKLNGLDIQDASSLRGPKGEQGERGPPGPPGPGYSGSSGTSSAGASCGNVLPSCPFWFNTNTSQTPAYGSAAVRFATSGFDSLYHPEFRPSYSCRFTDGRTTVKTSFVAIKSFTDPKTRKGFYSIECTPPTWAFTLPSTFSAVVNVSIWFLDQKEILFAGLPGWNQLTYYVQWRFFSQISSGLQFYGNGFDPSTSYICKYTNNETSVSLLSQPGVVMRNGQQVQCTIPVWNTSGSQRYINTQVSLWVTGADGSPAAEIPHSGTASQMMLKIDRCSDNVLNGDESDVDCGGLCKPCTSGKKCRNDTDCYQSSSTCDSSTNTCKQILVCTGWLYKGICLRSSISSSSTDRIPSGCSAYVPAVRWGRNDYLAICQHFGGQSQCNLLDTDADGGRCSNYRAILAYENTHQSANDVWVNSGTFTWNPTTTTSPNCRLLANPPGTIVYACK